MLAWIVDDDEEMGRAISLMLKLLGYESRQFLNARQAGRALLQGRSLPQVILLDINMPEVSGLDFLEFLRSRAQWRSLPVVMLSSETADPMIDRALALGANAYITKPVLLEELQRALNVVKA
ncbi:MAG: response regulator [Anaerolineales bacterium]